MESEETTERTGLLGSVSTAASGSSYGSGVGNYSGAPTHNGKVYERHLSLADASEQVVLSWEQINVWTPENKGGFCGRGRVVEQSKQILKNVNGIVHPGQLLAIIGASGAGKSTLMNVLTNRNRGQLTVEGVVRVNGQPIGNDITNISAYIQQDDIFISTLKVKEHLWFQAMLRMDKGISREARERRVSEVMTELGLDKCADTIIGKPGVVKGISGGEKKRLAFASEVLTNPSLLFCDEPTSGLDSFMAQSVVETLQNLASKGKTILCTIHQPSSEVFVLFDRLLILAEGRVAFIGPANEGLAYMEESGYKCPPNYNPSDFYIHTLAVVPGKEVECRAVVDKICNTFEDSQYYKDVFHEIQRSKDMGDSLNHDTRVVQSKALYKTSWCTQFKVVLWRSWINSLREPQVIRARVFQTLVIGILLGLIYLQQDYNQRGVMNINGALFLMQMQLTLGYVISVINTFPLEFPVYLREHHNGMYRVDVYYLSKIVAELPLFLILPVVFTAIVYWLVGLYNSWKNFLIAVACLILVANVSTSFGYVVSTSTADVTVAMTIGPVVMLPLMLFGGFFLNSGSVPIYFIWLQYLSWFNYSNEILVINQWESVTNITCEFNHAVVESSYNLGNILANLTTPFTPPSGGGKCFNNGNEVIESLSFSKDHLLTDYIVLGTMIVGFRLLSFILLAVRSRRKN